MTTQHPIPPNVVRFLHHPRVRGPALADALVHISRVRATLAPLDQPTALACFDAAELRTLIFSAVSTLNEALLDLGGHCHAD
jgi:hypothetical protein